jgi:hypothetical protein
VWSELSDREKFQFKNAPLILYDVEVKFGELFANDSEVYDLLSSEQIKFGLAGDIFKLSEAVNSTFSHKIYLNFSSMPENLKEIFLSRDVNFQGEKIKIKEILENFDVLSNLTCSEVRSIFEGRPVNISRQVEFKNNFFIERNFIDEEIEIESLEHYKNGEINNENPEVKNFSKILEQVKDSKIFILSSLAGEGKTVTFRNLTLKLKQENRQNWIQFVDLKKHFEAYKKGVKIDLNELEELQKFITKELLNLNQIESEIFKEQFASDRVTFLWDGIDEVAPLYKDFMLDLTSTIQSSSNNFQFISTRPQFSKDFRNKFNVKAHKLIPLGKFSRFEFLTKSIAPHFNKSSGQFWNEILNVSQGNFENLLKNSSEFYETNEKLFSLIKKAQTILDSLDKSKEEEHLITNPLLLRMITEILGDEKYDENFNFNFYQIYEIFVHKKLEIGRKKSDDIAKELEKVYSGVGFMKVHQAFALKHIFEDSLEDPLQARKFNTSDLKIMKSILKLSEEKISRFGILDVKSESDFTFVHQTLAEFLVARFFIDKFQDFDAKYRESDSDLKIFWLNSVLFTEKFKLVKKFLFDFAEIKDENFKSFEILQKFEIFSVQYKTVLLNFSNFENFKTFFGSNKSVKVLNFFDKMKSEIEENFLKNLNTREKLLSRSKKYQSFLYEIIATDETAEFVTKFLKVISKFLSDDEVLEMFLKKGTDNHQTPLMLASEKSKLKVLKAMWNFIEEKFNKNREQKQKILLMSGFYLNTALHHATQHHDPKVFLFIKEKYHNYLNESQIREIICQIQNHALPFTENTINDASFETALEVSKYLENLFENEKLKLRKLLSCKNTKKETIFSHSKYQEKLAKKLKLFVDLLRTTFNENQTEEFKKHFEDLKFDLKIFKNFSVDFQNFSVSNELYCSKDDFLFLVENFGELEKKLEKHNLNKILKLKIEFEKKTFLHVLASNGKNEKFLKIAQDYLNKPERLDLIYAKNPSHQTSLMLAAESSNFLEAFWNFHAQNLNEIEKKEFLLRIDSLNSFNAFHYSALSKNLKSFLFMKKIYEQFFTPSEIRKFIYQMALYNKYTFISIVIRDSSFQTTQEFSKYLETLFEHKKLELREILSQRDKDNESIFYSFKNDREFREKLKLFVVLLRKTFDESQEKNYKSFLMELQLKLNIFRDYTQNFQNFTFSSVNMEWSEDDFKFLINNFDELKSELGDERLKEVLRMQRNENKTILHDLFGWRNIEVFAASVLTKISSLLTQDEISNLIFTTDNDKETPLCRVITSRNLKNIKEVWKFFDKNLNEPQYKEILLLKNKHSKCLLETSSLFSDISPLLFLTEIYREKLNETKFHEILCKTFKNMILNLYIEDSVEFSEYFKNLFKNESLKLRKILMCRDKWGRSILSVFKDYETKNKILKIYIELLRKTFEENQEEEFAETLKSLEEEETIH